jgi:hypothetical protein
MLETMSRPLSKRNPRGWLTSARAPRSGFSAVTGPLEGYVANFRDMQDRGREWGSAYLASEIELLRRTQPASCQQLTFADHVHELDTDKGHRG